MEKIPENLEGQSHALIVKYGLVAGKNISSEKIYSHSPSSIPVNTFVTGILKTAVNLNKPIIFSDSDARISPIKKFEERGRELFVETETSTYRLIGEARQDPEDVFSWSDIKEVETDKGSTYRYLPDGTTQRFKKVENKEYEPQTALVYVPSYSWIKEHASPEILDHLGENETIYTEVLLEYVQNPYKADKKVYIVDKNGKKIETNQEIAEAEEPIYLAFLFNEKVDFAIPVFHKPRLGFMTFDTRRYFDEKLGETMRERHLGNPVSKIRLKDKE